MTKERKSTIAVISACVMLVFGILLTTIGFFVNPLGEVSDSVLWILGQALIYAGSIFGIATYTKGVIREQVSDLEQRYRNKKGASDETEA